jgi:hypothetical protein
MARRCSAGKRGVDLPNSHFADIDVARVAFDAFEDGEDIEPVASITWANQSAS